MSLKPLKSSLPHYDLHHTDHLNTKSYLEKGCRDFDVEVIDTHAIAGSIDGIHMDESGHKQVADVLISVIQEL